MKNIVFILFFTVNFTMKAQEKLPYYQIPEASKQYTAGSIASRMIDALGFRYYWATEGLTEKDLDFKPNDEARTTEETLDHILGLSQVILNAISQEENSATQFKMSFAQKRKRTLENLAQASTIVKESKDVSQYKIKFGNNELPFWNVINGPIADAIWHVGQVVSFRRSSGNPFPKGVSVLRGTKSE
ncbi:hypothetical protein DUT90_01675 [Polaribacter sp. WD7]|uniref:hypothetical protein n=1 Tax=Polaribacter sp. WD7 TaxID=2269061 RepID=UPI000DF3882F|nr:hypothetical protein [Polaribacter sp. WD7]RCS28316.1 hypothetical protein DUT90_01675 [Polaribacter sp. WD7]